MRRLSCNCLGCLTELTSKTKNSLADIQTKGSFARKEWNLFHLFFFFCGVVDVLFSDLFLSNLKQTSFSRDEWHLLHLVIILRICRCSVHFFRIESKQYRLLCRKESRRKCFANGEVKAQIYELVDDEAKIYFTGVTRSQHVELLLFARKE